MRSYAKLAAAVALSAASLVAVSARAEDAKPQYGGDLVLTGQLDKTMFPGRNTDAGGMDVYLNACENLVEMTADRTIKPVLAKSWSMSDDLKTITFQLNEGIQFHDGTPFDAEAVAFVFNEALAKKFLYVSLLEGLEKVVADSAYQVSFKLSKPSAALIPNLAYRTMCIFSPAAYKASGEEGLGSKIVGTGPFVLSEFTKGEYVLFKRNEAYWQKGKPYLDSIRILFVPEVATRMAMLESGDVDRAANIPDFDVPRLSTDDNLKVSTIPSLQQNYVVINNLKKPLDDPRVRQALNYAIDKAGIVKSVFAGTGAVLSQAPTLTPGVFGFADMREPGKNTIFAYDVDKAKDLLKRGGLRGPQRRQGARERAGRAPVPEALDPQIRQGRVPDRAAGPDLPREARHQGRADRSRERDLQRVPVAGTAGGQVRPCPAGVDHSDGGPGRADDVHDAHQGLEARGCQPHVLLQSRDRPPRRTGARGTGREEAGRDRAPLDGGTAQAGAGHLPADRQPDGGLPLLRP